MDLFEISGGLNLRSQELIELEKNIRNKKKNKKQINSEGDAEGDPHLMLRTYDLLDFIKKFLRQIE